MEHPGPVEPPILGKYGNYCDGVHWDGGASTDLRDKKNILGYSRRKRKEELGYIKDGLVED